MCRPRSCARMSRRGARFAIWCPTRCASTSPRAGCTARGRMLQRLVTKLLGTRFERALRRIQPIVDAIHAHEERLKDFSEADLKAQTARFRAALKERTAALQAEVDRLRQEKHDNPDPEARLRLDERLGRAESALAQELRAGLDDLLPEAFATVREASRRL